MRRSFSILVFFVMAMGLAACEPPGKPKFADITFDHLPPIELAVAEIIINTPYQESLEPPYVGEQFPVSPSRAARFRAGSACPPIRIGIGAVGAGHILMLSRS